MALAECAHEALRSGPSAELADCRAYELVTPRATNGAAPRAAPGQFIEFDIPTGHAFATSPAADGRFLYLIAGTDLPNGSGNGVSNVYTAIRSASGWSSTLAGPDGAQATETALEGASADLSSDVFEVDHQAGRYSGLLDLGGPLPASYYRTGTDDFHLVGEGTIPALPDEDGYSNGFADEPGAVVTWLSTDGQRMVFQTVKSGAPEKPARLLPGASPDGVEAVYERGSGGLRVASLLPDESAPPTDSAFAGASSDGSVVVFTTGGKMYARMDSRRTALVTDEQSDFAGISADGGRVFFSSGPAVPTGNLSVWSSRSESTMPIASSGDARVVNVSPDGSHVYFVSQSRLDGANGTDGQPNLYVWDGADTRFVATLATADMARSVEGGQGTEVGLGFWQRAVRGAPLLDTSRVNSSGSVIVFESSARLTPDAGSSGIEVYRFDADQGTLSCVSCDPGSEEPSNSTLASYTRSAIGTSALPANLSADGQFVVFQTSSRLAPSDGDSQTDVYEWHAGKLAQISLGDAARPSLFLGASPDAHDIFFRSAEPLVAEPQEAGIAAIYDARVDGGFQASVTAPDECVGEACRPQIAPPAPLPPLPSAVSRSRKRHRSKHHCRRHCPKRHRRGHHCIKRHLRRRSGAKRGHRRHGKNRCRAARSHGGRPR